MRTSVNPELVDQLYGTWTFVSQSEADLGYYKAKAYLVVHFMPDPSQTLGCSKDDCSEFQNQLCQDGGSICVNTETTQVEWSDVSALYQFGFQVDTGAVIKSHIRQGTGDWLGPYNVILAEAPKSSEEELAEARRRLDVKEDSTPLYVSRLVQTATSEFVKPPPLCNIVSDDIFDAYAGLTALQHSIKTQTSTPLDLSQDPYANQLNTCDNGNLQPVLPRFTIKGHRQDGLQNTTTASPPLEFALQHSVLSLPYKDNQLTKWWPTLQSRLTKSHLIRGPYCFDGALKAYTIDLNFAKQGQDPAWQFVKGCVDGLPCWHDTPPDSGGNHPGIPDATSSSILKWVTKYLGATGLIALSILLIVSLICNLRLCCKVRAKRRQLQQSQSQSDEEAGATAPNTMTTPIRQRRQTRSSAANGSNRQVARQEQAQEQEQQHQQQQQQPRSAQILTPSRLVRKREPASSESDTPELPKKNDPSAPLPPSMDRTPAAKNAPVGSNMVRTPVATKVAPLPPKTAQIESPAAN